MPAATAISPLDVFVLISGSFSVLATVPLLYLAVRAVRDGGRLRRLQAEVAELVVELHKLQGELHQEQRVAVSRIEDTRRQVEHVAERVQRRRLPRVRVRLEH